MIKITIDGVSGELAGRLMSDPTNGVSTITRHPSGYQITGVYADPGGAAQLLLAIDQAHTERTWPTKKRAIGFLRWVARSGEQDGTVPPPPRRPESRRRLTLAPSAMTSDDTQPITVSTSRHATTQDTPTSQLTRGFVPGFPGPTYYPVVKK